MKRRIRLLGGAQGDLAEAVAFYRIRDERIAARFITAVHRHIEIVAEHPDCSPVAAPVTGRVVELSRRGDQLGDATSPGCQTDSIAKCGSPKMEKQIALNRFLGLPAGASRPL
ncbi:MAG: hypothetical protein K1X64_18515 [Myxococcaceae bacterium]|nr:hypothetical protein [Myxococcaceae bacterium]